MFRHLSTPQHMEEQGRMEGLTIATARLIPRQYTIDQILGNPPREAGEEGQDTGESRAMHSSQSRYKAAKHEYPSVSDRVARGSSNLHTRLCPCVDNFILS